MDPIKKVARLLTPLPRRHHARATSIILCCLSPLLGGKKKKKTKKKKNLGLFLVLVSLLVFSRLISLFIHYSLSFFHVLVVILHGGMIIIAALAVLRPFRHRRTFSLAALTTVLSTTTNSTTALSFSKVLFHLSTTRRSSHAHFATLTMMVPPEESPSPSTTSTSTSTLIVVQFPCLQDNYGYLVHDSKSGATAAMDTPCARTYLDELLTAAHNNHNNHNNNNWTLTHIFNTHHHADHTGGNLALKEAFPNAMIVGPHKERHKIPGMDVGVEDGDVLDFGGSQVVVMDAGGHTKGHISFYFPNESILFVGDCLFSLGCGKMFEGTPEQFWKAIEKHRALPDDTLMYCAHEYTASNAKFAMSVEPGNPHLVQRVAEVQSQRSRQEPTIPTLLGDEKKTNPFLRVDVSEEIRRNIGVLDTDTPAQAFGKLRHAKDHF